MSSTNGTRIHSIGSMFKSDKISFWFYDSFGIVRTDDSQSLSLVDQFEEVAAIVVAIACCDATRLGVMQGVTPPKGSKYPASFPPANLTGYTIKMPLPNKRRARQPQMVVTLDKPLFCQYALVGRHTTVYTATTSVAVGRKKGRAVIVKLSQQAKGRKPEQDFLNAALEAGVDHLPELHSSIDLWSLSDGIRSVFLKRDPGHNEIFEDRILRAIVYTQYIPVQQFLAESSDAPEYIRLMVDQMMECLHDLRHKAKIVHRDVSPNNIMIEMRNDKPFFILNDFDLATFVQDNGTRLHPASSKHRTGTLPFMAIEILQDMDIPLTVAKPGRIELQIAHRLRHDWESLLWVALWCMLTTDPDASGTELESKIVSFLSDWETGELSTIADVKISVIHDSSRAEKLIPPRFRTLIPWFARWCDVLRDAHQVIKRHRLLSRKELVRMDRETLNGTITLEKLKEALHAPDEAAEEEEEEEGEEEEEEEEHSDDCPPDVTENRVRIIEW
ncbi:uncharacterized protein PHACADRAFT_202165 [Phanerochaete carnosa HHB-10118-sp]|uniref:Protein kinase domain-containing protein n=1 Tax=Phanerochaete carnosa (strain HHB-10118-sp) TaxID=650164 RepID=K5VQX4_PHACS|nr:uncharacterized protein PHACADRAFT_202165 [Phanerochaete carnosa HHB-10118-sp]EKM48974.1 hypothetical protein PHACADRAFT_202165 [Phanerochaete carnosa HHB-10118-sp]